MVVITGKCLKMFVRRGREVGWYEAAVDLEECLGLRVGWGLCRCGVAGEATGGCRGEQFVEPC